MRNVFIVLLALVTSFGFSQDKETKKELRQKMMQERQDLTPQQKAELNTKRLTLQLDLSEAQQKEVHKLQLEMITNRQAMMEGRKAKVEETAYYEKASARLDMRQQYQEKMKTILSESQYTTWKEDMKKSKRTKAIIKQKK